MNSKPVPGKLVKALDNLWSSSADRNWIVGRLGVKTGSSTYDIDVVGRAGIVYVSLGSDGTLGQATATDAVGVAKTGWQMVRMRRENGALVIREAEEYAGGTGGGASNLNALTDVTLASPSNGQVLVYDSTTSQWKNQANVAGSGAPSPHGLSSSHHNSTLNWSLINYAGSNLTDIVTRLHANLQGIGPNDHHNQQHAIVSSDHTASGLTTGNTIRATGPTTFAWAQLQHTDLGNVLPDQHHYRAHNITTGDAGGQVHTISGSAFDVVGATGTNTLGILTPSSSPGAAAAILRTDSSGSMSLDTNLLYVDAVNNRIGINRAASIPPGAAALDVQVSALADHTQRIKQVSGQTGRMWRIEDTGGNELIVLDAVGNLQSGQPGFVSGLTGWQISYLGNAEFNNVWVRGELHATVFVKDEVHATGGTLLVATAGKLHTQATIDSLGADIEPLEIVSSVPGVSGPLTIVTTSGTFSGTTLDVRAILNYLEIDDPPSGPGFYFTAGDVIRSKTEVTTGVTDFWLEVNNPKQFTGYSRYSVIKRSGTDGILPAGSAVVSYGKPGAGRILLTSDLNYAPYMDVFNVGPNVWTGAAGAIVPRVRLGRLDGVGVVGVSGVEQYGIVAGTDLSNTNAPYFVASNLQMKLYKINITLNDGTNDTAQINQNGSLSLGSNIGTLAGKSFQVINGTGTTQDGNVIIGQESGNYLKWNQNTGVLSIVGSVTVSGGTVSQAYVDDGDKRNATAVGGTWTVGGPTSLSWGSPGVAFVMLRGVVCIITAGSLSGLNTTLPTYLYVDVTAATPYTLQQHININVLGLNHVVVAVFNPGPIAGSITLMGGTTYISGSNIITGTITATQIHASTITANELATGSVTAIKINVGSLSAVQANTGTLIVGDSASPGAIYSTDKLTWSTNVAGGGFYLGWDTTGGVNAYKFYVGDFVNYISWNGTDLTVAGKTSSLDISGSVTVGVSGAVLSSGKTYGSNTPGFFLGWNLVSGSGVYQFDIGDNTNYLRWNGATLSFLAKTAITFTAIPASSALWNYADNASHSGSALLNWIPAKGVLELDFVSTDVRAGGDIVSAHDLIAEGDVLQLRTQLSKGATSSQFGNRGEIGWEYNTGTGVGYIYICVADNLWRRIPIPAAPWGGGS